MKEEGIYTSFKTNYGNKQINNGPFSLPRKEKKKKKSSQGTTLGVKEETFQFVIKSNCNMFYSRI